LLRVTAHPLAVLIADAAAGSYPAVDGGWHRVPPWRPDVEAVVAFTGHAVFAVRDDVTDDTLARLGADGFGGASHPALLTGIAGPEAWIDSLDAVLVAEGSGTGGRLVERPDLRRHPRAQHADGVREVRQVLGYADPKDSTVVIISAGIGGLTEISFELDPAKRGRGEGRQLVEDALSAVPAGDLVLAGVAPGNAASFRALLASGFRPVASVQLFRRQGLRSPHGG
jgi:GNAT superfamily N-acetyltransferase